MWYYQNAFYPSEYLCHYGVKGMKWGVRRTPEQLGHYKKTMLPKMVKSGEVSLKVNREKQGRHILGDKNFVSGKSYLLGDHDFAQSLIDKYSNTGKKIPMKSGEWTRRERVVCDEVVGVYIDPQTGRKTKTKSAMIIYSKTGTHIYPRKDDDSDGS